MEIALRRLHVIVFLSLFSVSAEALVTLANCTRRLQRKKKTEKSYLDGVVDRWGLAIGCCGSRSFSEGGSAEESGLSAGASSILVIALGVMSTC